MGEGAEEVGLDQALSLTLLLGREGTLDTSARRDASPLASPRRRRAARLRIWDDSYGIGTSSRCATWWRDGR
jgi:hypothetical protein